MAHFCQALLRISATIDAILKFFLTGKVVLFYANNLKPLFSQVWTRQIRFATEPHFGIRSLG
jgi:hypothetical protein